MDALRIFRGFLTTTWLAFWFLTILTFSVDSCTGTWTVYLIVKLIFLTNMNEKKCCVRNCNKTRADNTILHIFPKPEKELDRFNKWIYAIGGNVLVIEPDKVYKHGRVCHNHFDSKYYTSSNRLSKNAVPSLNIQGIASSQLTVQNFERLANLNMGQAVEPTANTSTATPPQEEINQSGRNRLLNFDHHLITLRDKIKKLQSQKDSAVTRLKKAMKLSENESFKMALGKFSKPAAIFTKLQFREVGKHRLGCRFSKQEKILSLALYKQGPRAYRWLQNFFVLPSPLTLSRMISTASLHPGINENLFRQLEKRVKKMNETEKLCTLLFDEVALTPHFDYNRREDCVTGFVNYGNTSEDKICIRDMY